MTWTIDANTDPIVNALNGMVRLGILEASDIGLTHQFVVRRLE